MELSRKKRGSGQEIETATLSVDPESSEKQTGSPRARRVSSLRPWHGRGTGPPGCPPGAESTLRKAPRAGASTRSGVNTEDSSQGGDSQVTATSPRKRVSVPFDE